MQTPKSRSGSSDAPQRVSPRAVRQIRTTALESNPASSSNQASRTPKERNPKVVERRSPRSPATSEKQRPSRMSVLESQISQLQEDLKKAKDQLDVSELWKKQSQKDAEDTKKELLAMSAKLEQSQQQLLELSASNETYPTKLNKISQEVEKAFQCDPEIKQLYIDNTLTTLESEIQQPEMEAETKATQRNDMETPNTELESLKGNLAETLFLVENMKIQLLSSKESEARALALVSETLLQLESAKKTVEDVRSDDIKATETEAYNSVSSEFDQSRAHVSLLEDLASTMEAESSYSSNSLAQSPSGTSNPKQVIGESTVMQGANKLESELYALKSEVQHLRSTLEIAETKYQEEQIRSIVQMSSTHELLEQSKTILNLKEGEFQSELQKIKAEMEHLKADLMDKETELKKIKAEMEDLKADLMDKETELQGISEENTELNSKLEKSQLYQRENELSKAVKELKESVAETNVNLVEETGLQNNEMLKMEIKKRVINNSEINYEAIMELEVARNAEREALTKLGLVIEDTDKREMRTAEQIQAAHSEMEGELRRLKVQSDQWRKAAEAAAAMLSSGNNGNFTERIGSLDDSYNSVNRKTNLPYSEDINDDLLKKKNGNMLKKIGVLWKKPHK